MLSLTRRIHFRQTLLSWLPDMGRAKRATGPLLWPRSRNRSRLRRHHLSLLWCLRITAAALEPLGPLLLLVLSPLESLSRIHCAHCWIPLPRTGSLRRSLRRSFGDCPGKHLISYLTPWRSPWGFLTIGRLVDCRLRHWALSQLLLCWSRNLFWSQWVRLNQGRAVWTGRRIGDRLLRIRDN